MLFASRTPSQGLPLYGLCGYSGAILFIEDTECSKCSECSECPKQNSSLACLLVSAFFLMQIVLGVATTRMSQHHNLFVWWSKL